MIGYGRLCAWLVLFCVVTSAAAWAGVPRACTGHGVELQVLGSGGPELSDRRASSSYLVWQDRRARILIDAGGGSALRFGQAGARVGQLDAILLSHLHIDHVADFPALMKSAYFEDLHRSLPVFGPGGNQDFPATSQYVADLFDPEHGAYRYLGPFLLGPDADLELKVQDVIPSGQEIVDVMSVDGLRLSAVKVTHGQVPALAWRVVIGGKTLVFSGDTNGKDGSLGQLARGADILVMHNAIPEDVDDSLKNLHMPPSVIGHIASSAAPRLVVLSHRMLRTLGREAETRRTIAASYSGPVVFANDLDCFR